MVSEDVVAKVFDIAHDLMRRGPTEEEIDGRFLFEVWDREWIGWVEETRRSLFGRKDAPHRGTRPHGDPAPIERLDPKTRQRLSEKAEAKCRETGLWQLDVIRHILTGSPIALPRLSLISDPNGIAELPIGLKFRPKTALLVYSEDVSPTELAGFFAEHFRSTAPALIGVKPKRRFQEGQERTNLVRTWAVSCLAKQGGMTARKAISLWSERYPEDSYGSREQADPPKKRELRGHSVTSTAESQYSRDKKRLFERLHLTR